MDHTQHMEEISNIKNGIMELLDNMDKSIEFLQRETNLSKLNQVLEQDELNTIKFDESNKNTPNKKEKNAENLLKVHLEELDKLKLQEGNLKSEIQKIQDEVLLLKDTNLEEEKLKNELQIYRDLVKASKTLTHTIFNFNDEHNISGLISLGQSLQHFDYDLTVMSKQQMACDLWKRLQNMSSSQT